MTHTASNRGRVVLDFHKDIQLSAVYAYGPSGSFGMGPKRLPNAIVPRLDVAIVKNEDSYLLPSQIDDRLRPFDALFKTQKQGSFAERMSVENWISLAYGLATVLRGEVGFQANPDELDGPLGSLVDKDFDFFANSKLWNKLVRD